MTCQLALIKILLINLSYSMQRYQARLLRAPNNNQSSDEPKEPVKSAREGEDDTNIHIHAKFPSVSSRHFLPICTPEVPSRESDSCCCWNREFLHPPPPSLVEFRPSPHCRHHQRWRKHSFTGKIALYMMKMSRCRDLKTEHLSRRVTWTQFKRV